MKLNAASPSFFIGWDVGGWNCDKNGKSRDALVILDDTLAVVGQPWRGNLRVHGYGDHDERLAQGPVREVQSGNPKGSGDHGY